ncbi:MAG: hypothetical protein RIT43_358 [Bacteroidota bacterium]|jgi:hypothetical protein
MDTFLRRLKYYGIGFLLGLLFVVFFFKNRGCSWLPSNRVKTAILERVIVLAEQEKKILKSKGVSKKDLLQLIQESEISFSKSRRSGKEKAYAMEAELPSGKTLQFFMTLPEESFVSEVIVSQFAVDKVHNSKAAKGEVIRFPSNKNLLFLGQRSLNECLRKTYNVSGPDALFKFMQSKCDIDFSKTSFIQKPKPEHYLETRINDTLTLGMRAVWYKERIDIVAVDPPCE